MVDRSVLLQIHTSKMTENSFIGRDVDLYDLAQLTKNFRCCSRPMNTVRGIPYWHLPGYLGIGLSIQHCLAAGGLTPANYAIVAISLC